MSSLYIFEITNLSEVSLANMFSHTVDSLFILILFSLVKNCFEQWKKCLDRCIALNGEYFEGD